jgi:branched-chain amino acid transport system ATP-binding protein
MEDLIRVSGLSKRFGMLTVVDGLSFELKRGETLGILGPNGAGKSTLFNLITGDERVSAGSIFFEGQDITHLPAYMRARRGIGRSYQIPKPFGGMTVYENLLVAATFASGNSEAACHRHCIEVLDQTQLLAKSNARAGALTLLERKRLELARALATRPQVLLLDEIAGGLTESECHTLVETIKQVISLGVSIIWIEHIVHALLSVVSRLLVINFGKELAEGEPHAVMANPLVQEIYMGIEAE